MKAQHLPIRLGQSWEPQTAREHLAWISCDMLQELTYHGVDGTAGDGASPPELSLSSAGTPERKPEAKDYLLGPRLLNPCPWGVAR